jgi:hypothetical protein
LKERDWNEEQKHADDKNHKNSKSMSRSITLQAMTSQQGEDVRE